MQIQALKGLFERKEKLKLSTEAQKKASKKYYQSHKEYYKKKAIENSKKVRRERRELLKKIKILEGKAK